MNKKHAFLQLSVASRQCDSCWVFSINMMSITPFIHHGEVMCRKELRFFFFGALHNKAFLFYLYYLEVRQLSDL